MIERQADEVLSDRFHALNNQKGRTVLLTSITCFSYAGLELFFSYFAIVFFLPSLVVWSLGLFQSCFVATDKLLTDSYRIWRTVLDGATEKYNKDEINDLKMYMQKLHNFLSCNFLSYNFSYKEINLLTLF